MDELKEELLQAKLALFSMIDQFMYEVTDENGVEYFDDYCESAGEHAFSALGFEEDRISKEDFYRKYDELDAELRKMNGNDYFPNRLQWYQEDKAKQTKSAFDTYKSDIILRVYSEDLKLLGFDEIPPTVDLQLAIYDAIEIASKVQLNETKWRYVVNTFDGSNPVQLSGWITACSEFDAVQKLKDNGTIDPRGYEFLELEQDKGCD